MTDHVDSSAEELPAGAPAAPAETRPAAAPAQAAQSAELARRPVSNEVLVPLDIGQQKAAMEAYQQGLQALLSPSDWQGSGNDKFVKKSGWRKIAAWFNLSIENVREEVARDGEGAPLRCTVWARAIAPNGRFADGDGHCSTDESRFSSSKGRQKLENDLIGTATTRAINRAVSNLVGMGAVSAEEVDAGSGGGGPAFGPRADDDLKGRSYRAFCYLLDLDAGASEAPQAYKAFGKALEAGYMPAIVAKTIVTIANAKRAPAQAERAAQDAAAEQPEGEHKDPATGLSTGIDQEMDKLVEEGREAAANPGGALEPEEEPIADADVIPGRARRLDPLLAEEATQHDDPR